VSGGVGELRAPAGCRTPAPVPVEGPVAVVAARFNAEIVQALVDGAVDRLAERGIGRERVTLLTVPGAFELGLASRQAAAAGFAAVVALGCVIRGETPHFDYVCAEAARGIADAAAATGVPVAFGVLTVENADQAWDRAGGRAGNKGADAADAAVDMAELLGALAVEARAAGVAGS
jgi:6,7-dimethyl-8-ribityllumazine synthase